MKSFQCSKSLILLNLKPTNSTKKWKESNYYRLLALQKYVYKKKLIQKTLSLSLFCLFLPLLYKHITRQNTCKNWLKKLVHLTLEGKKVGWEVRKNQENRMTKYRKSQLLACSVS